MKKHALILISASLLAECTHVSEMQQPTTELSAQQKKEVERAVSFQLKDKLRPIPSVEDVAPNDADTVASVLQKMALAGATLRPDDPVIEDVRALMGVSAPPPAAPELMGLASSAPGPGGNAGGGPRTRQLPFLPGGGPAPEPPPEPTSLVAKSNPNHDELGRFASGPGGAVAAVGAPPTQPGRTAANPIYDSSIRALTDELAAKISRVEFDRAPVHDVMLSTLKSGQKDLNPKKVARFAEEWDRNYTPLYVLQEGKDKLLLEGNHRVAAAEKLGMKNLRAHVLVLDEARRRELGLTKSLPRPVSKRK